MPFATNGRISQDPIEGGVEISNEQYALALDGMLVGQVVMVDDGFKVVDPPASEDPETSEPDEPAYVLLKEVFINRLTTSEAESVEQVLAMDAKMRLWFNSHQYLISNSQLFHAFETAVSTVLEQGRATDLLSVDRKVEW